MMSQFQSLAIGSPIKIHMVVVPWVEALESSEGHVSQSILSPSLLTKQVVYRISYKHLADRTFPCHFYRLRLTYSQFGAHTAATNHFARTSLPPPPPPPSPSSVTFSEISADPNPIRIQSPLSARDRSLGFLVAFPFSDPGSFPFSNAQFRS